MELAAKAVPMVSWIEQVLQQADDEWLIPGFLPAKGFTVLTGRPKLAKKSWMAAQMGLAIASGKPLGPFKPTKRGKVLYYHREGPPKATAHRFKALTTAHTCPLEVLNDYYIVPFGEYYLDEPMYVDETISHIGNLGIDLVIVDTFARSFQGEENSSKDVMTAVRGIDRICNAGAAVLLIHHTKKGRLELRGDIPDPDAGMRGSGAMAAAYDHIISIQDLVIDGELGLWVITGGKNQDFVAYKQDWDIRGDLKGNAVFAQLSLLGPQDLPQVDEPNRKGRRDKGKEEQNY